MGASTMSMFSYAVATALGGNPGLRDDAAKETEKRLRNRDPTVFSASSTVPGFAIALRLTTFSGGPEVYLAAASADENWEKALADLAAWPHLQDMDVVVFNSVLHYACNWAKDRGRSVDAHVAYLNATYSAWLAATDSLPSRPVLVWRSATQLNPTVAGNPCPAHAFPTLPAYTAAGNAFWKSVGVSVVDQFAISGWVPLEQRPADGLHFYPDTPVQDVSANIFVNMLCREEIL